MTHHTINGLITGIAVIFLGVIIAAVLFGPDSATRLGVPGSDTAEDVSVSDDMPEGVGGVASDTTATPTPSWSASGVVLDAESGEPIEGATVEADSGGVTASETTTDADGGFSFERVPATAVLVINADGYHAVEIELDEDGEYAVELESSVISGRVVGPQGSPLRGATVASGDVYTRTVQNGAFSLEDAPAGEDIIVKFAGHAPAIIARGDFTGGVTLAPLSKRGIYVAPEAVADQERFNELLGLLSRTELNTMVVDLKDRSGRVFHESSVELAGEIGAVQPVYDAAALVDTLHDRGLNAVARITVFEDPMLAEARPDLAIRDSQTGEIWRTWQDGAWTNPYSSEVREYNIALIEEAISLGFDEIQLDYARFPTEGPLNRVDYGEASTASKRQAAIESFLDAAYDVAGPTPSMLTLNTFGLTLWYEGEGEIGQDLVSVAERVDYVHPMIYPSHFVEGSIGFDMPGDHPYEVVFRSLESGFDTLPGHLSSRIRPWLQDFSYGVGMPYGEEQVRAQIDAANNAGASGWMLWNGENFYHEGQLGRGD